MKRATVRISEASPRHSEWVRIFGSDTIPIVSTVAKRADLPGKPDVFVYDLDLEALDEGQRRRLVEHITEKFHLQEESVWRDLKSDHGVPILDEDLLVSFDVMRL
jgi:hypothetical protein